MTAHKLAEFLLDQNDDPVVFDGLERDIDIVHPPYQGKRGLDTPDGVVDQCVVVIKLTTRRLK